MRKCGPPGEKSRRTDDTVNESSASDYFAAVDARTRQSAERFAPFKPQFRAMEEWAYAALDSMKGRVDGRWRGWVAYQMARCIRIFRSCGLLLAHGQCTESLALTRGLFDSMLTVYWVAQDPDERIVRVIEGSTWKEREMSLKALRDAAPEERRYHDMLDEIFSEQRPKNIPSTRQLAEGLLAEGLMLYGTLYSMSSAFLHGQGGELQYLYGFTGEKTLSVDPLPSRVGFDISVLSLHETFRVAIGRAARALGVDAGDPPLSAEFAQWRAEVMKNTATTDQGPA